MSSCRQCESFGETLFEKEPRSVKGIDMNSGQAATPNQAFVMTTQGPSA